MTKLKTSFTTATCHDYCKLSRDTTVTWHMTDYKLLGKKIKIKKEILEFNTCHFK